MFRERATSTGLREILEATLGNRHIVSFSGLYQSGAMPTQPVHERQEASQQFVIDEIKGFIKRVEAEKNLRLQKRESVLVQWLRRITARRSPSV